MAAPPAVATTCMLYAVRRQPAPPPHRVPAPAARRNASMGPWSRCQRYATARTGWPSPARRRPP